MATQGSTQIKTIIGDNIADARDKQGITQQQLATALATSVSRVSDWERGITMPRNPQAIADLLFDGDILRLFRAPEPPKVAA